MKYLLTTLIMSVTTGLFAHAEHLGLYSEIQDNGQSCVYSLKANGDGKIDRFDRVSIDRVTTQSVAIEDVVTTLENRYDNYDTRNELVVGARKVLSGGCVIYLHRLKNTNFLLSPFFAVSHFLRKLVGHSCGESRTSFSNLKKLLVLMAIQKTRSQESVACAKKS